MQGLIEEIMTLKAYEKIEIKLLNNERGSIVWTKTSNYREIIDMQEVKGYNQNSNKGK